LTAWRQQARITFYPSLLPSLPFQVNNEATSHPTNKPGNQQANQLGRHPFPLATLHAT